MFCKLCNQELLAHENNADWLACPQCYLVHEKSSGWPIEKHGKRLFVRHHAAVWRTFQELVVENMWRNVRAEKEGTTLFCLLPGCNGQLSEGRWGIIVYPMIVDRKNPPLVVGHRLCGRCNAIHSSQGRRLLPHQLWR